MFYILIAIACFLICYKFGDWRNWKIYYPTILFFILSSLACNLFTYNHPLWLYQSVIIDRTFTDLFISVTIYPCTVMMFIPHLPGKITKMIFYISFYVAICTIGEFIAVKIGYFNYYNGWTIWHSLIFNCLMFPILILHYRKPLYAWMIALISPHILFFLMKIPYSSIR